MDEVARTSSVGDNGPTLREQDLLAPPPLSDERARLRALAVEESNSAARRHYRYALRKIMARVEADETLRSLLVDLDAAVVDLVVERQDQVLDRVVIGILLDDGTPNLVDLRTTRRTRISPSTCLHEECGDALRWLSVASPTQEETGVPTR